jgi:hypothetical protein
MATNMPGFEVGISFVLEYIERAEKHAVRVARVGKTR